MKSKIIIGIAILIFLLILGVLFGKKIDNKDTKKKQKKILIKKGYQFDEEYNGSGLTSFDLFLDQEKKKILFFKNRFYVYNFNDLKNLEISKEVNEGKFTYLIHFMLQDAKYAAVLKGNINEKNKLKYEELSNILRKVEKENKCALEEAEKRKQEEQRRKEEKRRKNRKKEQKKEEKKNTPKKDSPKKTSVSQKKPTKTATKTTNQKRKNHPKNTNKGQKTNKKSSQK